MLRTRTPKPPRSMGFFRKLRQDFAGACVGLSHSQLLLDSIDPRVAQETARHLAPVVHDLDRVLDAEEVFLPHLAPRREGW